MSDDSMEITGVRSPVESHAATESAGSVLGLDDFLGGENDTVSVQMSALFRRHTEGAPVALANFASMDPDVLRKYKQLLFGFGRKEANEKAAFDYIVDKKFVGFENFRYEDDPEFETKAGSNVKVWLKRCKRGIHVASLIIPTYIGMCTPTVEEKNS